MNKVNAYCILDTKSTIFNQPHFLINDAVALRQFQMIVQDKESMISKYPEDYRLYCVGSFDMLTGTFTPELSPREIAHGLQFKKEQ
ncbi:MAG: nonstructural protein [Microvirus sp.]|nr:MAG: nonstructural protein [Microvirus sp.]